MNNKSLIWIILLVCGAVGLVYPDGGYEVRGTSTADWWTQKTDIEFPVRIEVADSLPSMTNLRGAFAVGGDSSTGYVPLTHNFHWPDDVAGEHFVVVIDGTFYSFANYSPMQLNVCGTPRTLYQINDYFVGTDTTEDADGNVTIESHWRIPVMDGFIDLYQYLTPVYMIFGGDTSSDTCGMAKIQFRAINNHYLSHTVGIKLFVDLEIGTGPDADHPQIAVAGTFTNYSKLFTPPVPGYWQGGEDYPFGPTTVVARGVLRGGDATPPDYF
ncbi:MAG TPA: hypothetical protein ENG11_00465, partial [candidate division Zixibacteria bacterium]|nr:hypothetical protein [candidate division Zixibacteria bacterium]